MIDRLIKINQRRIDNETNLSHGDYMDWIQIHENLGNDLRQIEGGRTVLKGSWEWSIRALKAPHCGQVGLGVCCSGLNDGVQQSPTI